MTKILKNLLLFFSITVAVIYFTSCVKYSFLIETKIIEDPISYYDEVQPILDAKCVSCHRGSLAPDLRPANSYKALSEGGFLTQPAESSKLYEYIFVKNNHISYTNQDERDIIYSWLLQGAPEEPAEED